MRRTLLLLAVTSVVVTAADPAYDSAEAKLDRISNYQLKPGETIVFTPTEINSWARVAVPETVHEGIRNPRVELGVDTATGYALVDFLKMRQAQGRPTNPLIAKMLEGERPLKIFVRVESGGGRCTVHLTRVELGNGSAEGAILDFLVKNFFLPLFPDAKIDEPFDLDYDMDKIEIRPEGIRVTAKNRR